MLKKKKILYKIIVCDGLIVGYFCISICCIDCHDIFFKMVTLSSSNSSGHFPQILQFATRYYLGSPIFI